MLNLLGLMDIFIRIFWRGTKCKRSRSLLLTKIFIRMEPHSLSLIKSSDLAVHNLLAHNLQELPVDHKARVEYTL